MPAFRDLKPSSSKDTAPASTTNLQAGTEPSNRANSSSSTRFHPFFRHFVKDKKEKGNKEEEKVEEKEKEDKKGEEAEDEGDNLEYGANSEEDDLDIDFDGYDDDYDEEELGLEDIIEEDEEEAEAEMASANMSTRLHGSTVVQPNSLPIPRFFGGGKDPLGRTLNQILSWNDERLERQHNYIQVIFPLPEQSYFAGSDCPVLDESSIAVFQASAEHRFQLFRAFQRMMSFYGFDVNVKSNDARNPMKDNERTVTVTPNDEFEEKVLDWLGGHNNMRITRIIRSLRLLGLGIEAEAYYKALDDFRKEVLLSDANTRLQRRFRGDSFVYWTRAAKRPLFIPPDATDEQAERMILKRAKNSEKARAALAGLGE